MAHGASKMKPVPKAKPPLEFEYKILCDTAQQCELKLNHYHDVGMLIGIEHMSAAEYGTTIIIKVKKHV